MGHTSTILAPLLLKFSLLTVVAAKPLTHDELDQILDPEELLNMVLPPPSDSAWFEWDDWDTWQASQDMKNNFTYYRSGYDEDGLVVHMSSFGKYKYRELVQSPPEKIEEFWKYHEQLIRRAQMDGRRDNNKGIVYILDFEGFSLQNFASAKALKLALKLFISCIRLNSQIKYGFFINVNYAAESFIMLAKPFIGNFIEKFEIYGTRREKWRPRLMRKIPASQLPPEIGGFTEWKPLPEQATES